MVSFFGKKSLKFAIPFFVFMVGGSVGLREFTSLRYRYRLVESVNPREEAKKLGISVKSPEKITLEAQYKEMKKQNLDEWENKRIPRPAYYGME